MVTARRRTCAASGTETPKAAAVNVCALAPAGVRSCDCRTGQASHRLVRFPYRPTGATESQSRPKCGPLLRLQILYARAMEPERNSDEAADENTVDEADVPDSIDVQPEDPREPGRTSPPPIG